MQTGKLIVFEGVDGSGKSTQMSMLASRLVADGYDVITTKQPGACQIGQQLRDIMLHQPTRLPIRGELMLMLADRVCHIEQVIKPALRDGYVVLCDRFTWSSVVYQGIVGGLGVDKVSELNDWVVGDLVVDRLVYCDVDVETSQQRIHDRGQADAIERSGNVEQLIAGYRKLVRRGGQNVVLLHSGGTIDRWGEIVYDNISELLQGDQDGSSTSQPRASSADVGQ